jgi:hypothetical protein
MTDAEPVRKPLYAGNLAAVVRPDRRPRYSVGHVGAPAESTADGGHDHQAGVVLPVGQCGRRGVDVPGGRRIWPAVEPSVRCGCQRFSPTRRGRGARGVDDGRRERQRHRLALFAAPVRGAHRRDRQHDEAGHRLDRGQTVCRAQRRGLEGHPDRSVGLHVRQPRHPRRLHHRAAVCEELSAAGDRADRRGETRRGRDHTGPQVARDPDGADSGQDVHKAGDPHPLSEPGVVR